MECSHDEAIRLWTPLPDFPSEEEGVSQALQEFASFLEAGEGSRDGGRANMLRALDVAICVVEPGLQNTIATPHGSWRQELAELLEALRMADSRREASCIAGIEKVA